jgi:inorganic pyrophosphatase
MSTATGRRMAHDTDELIDVVVEIPRGSRNKSEVREAALEEIARARARACEPQPVQHRG